MRAVATVSTILFPTVDRSCHMRHDGQMTRIATPQDRIQIAAVTYLSERTVSRYFKGTRIHPSGKHAIETACKRLKVMTYDQAAAHEQDPRTLGEV